MSAIQMQQVSKSYDGVVRAVDSLSLDIRQGAVFGFLGPNGSGKTTTVKLLNGLLLPTAGRSEVLGVDPVKDPAGLHAICGVHTESARPYGHLTGFENLRFFASVFDIRESEARPRIEHLLKAIDLYDAKDKKVKAYSTGMMQRLSIARALLHRPQVLFLDEPTSGLDPESAHVVNGMIVELAKSEGVTVFLCTHQLRYAEELCTEYGLISKGALLKKGTFDELVAGVGYRHRARVRLTGEPADMSPCKEGGGWWEAPIDERGMPELLKKLIMSGCDIYEAKLVRPTLEELYFGYFTQKEAAA